MLISILIPTRNRLEYLRQALGSALRQTGAEIEVIVSDDGSTDGTPDYVAAIARADSRVRLLTDNPHPGIFSNVEYLIAASHGEAFTVLGDDDFLDDDFCALLAAPLSDPAVILTFCDHRTIGHDGRVVRQVADESSCCHGRLSLPSGPLKEPELTALRGAIWLGFALYRREVFNQERFDPDCGMAADWDLAIRAAGIGRIEYVRGQHGSYRDHPGTASRLQARLLARSKLHVLMKHRMRDPHAEKLRLELLLDAAKRAAYQQAAIEPAEAMRSIEVYRLNGGHALNPHIVLARTMLMLPPLPAGLLFSVASAVANIGRRLGRAFGPRSSLEFPATAQDPPEHGPISGQ